MTEYTEKTIKELGAYVTAPKLSEKLLSKPPFRYLHDIVMSFMKATGFPTGLYPDAMLDFKNVEDKESKIQFLTMLIAAIEAATGKTCEAKPQKIVSGKEPELTNQMLQLLASCASLSAEKKAAAVAKAKGGEAASPPPPPPPPPAAAPETKPEKREKDKPKDKPKEREKAKEAEGKKKATETEEERHLRHEEERSKRHEEKRREKAAGEERRRSSEEDDKAAATAAMSRGSGQFAGSSGSKEPATAGKAPPRTKPTHEVVAAHGGGGSDAPAAGVIAEAKRSDKGRKREEDGEEEEEDWMKVAERFEQKPSALTAGGVAANAEVKGKLGQQALKAKREQEEAAQQAQAAANAAGATSGGGIIISKGKGGPRGAHGAAGASMNDTELQRLREQLQLLTKASNPLGKFLEAAHDDIDSMTRELETWRSEARNQAMAAAEARRQTQENLQEIQAQLQSMEDAISDQVLKTNNLRKTILANDAAIEGMLGMIVGPDVASAAAPR